MSVSYSAYQPSGQLGSKLEHVIITFQKNEIPLFGRAVEVVGWQSIFIVILCTLKQVSDEVAEMFKEFDRKEAAYRLRTYRHKAYYSLNRDDGLEHEAVFVALSPHELYERKVTMQELHAAIASLLKNCWTR